MNFLDKNAHEEIKKLQNYLDSNDQTKREKGIRKTIALMRSGETSVKELFTSMLRCVGTSNISLKKLIYIYLTTFSSDEPEQSIMAVNAFIKDSEDYNPIIRALAVRTMCRIKIDTVAEYMLVPLKQRLSDENAYVRKTAALAVSKLYEIIPESVENSDLLPILLKLTTDENPMVVSNAALALFEINERRTEPIFILNQENVSPLLSATTQCSEWVLVSLLDSISHYKPPTAEESNFLIDRLIPLMKHSNPSVVIGAFRCIYIFVKTSDREISDMFAQTLPSFASLISSGSDPEISYVVLRCFSLFVQKYPRCLERSNIRLFFCKYNDPCYVKVEKLSIIVSLADQKNALLVVNELEEYCNDVDVLFVKKTIECLGRIALKIQCTARHIVDILAGQLTDSKASYAIEATILVFKDIFRVFPGEFESIITRILSHCEGVKEPESRAAVIWMLGQYSPIIVNVDQLIDPFLDSFSDEDPRVQSHVVTSIVKIFLDRGDAVKDQLQFVLDEATKENVSPDVRNKALIYWRLLSLDKKAATDVVVRECLFVMDGQKSSENDGVPHQFSTQKFDQVSLDLLIANMGKVSGVLHVLPDDFVKEQLNADSENEQDGHHRSYNNSLIDAAENIKNDLMRNWRKCTIKNDNGIVDVFVDWQHFKLFVKVVNKSDDLSNFAIAVNKNPIGIELKDQVSFPEKIGYGEAFELELNLMASQKMIDFEICKLQVALRTSKGTMMFDVPIDLSFFASNCTKNFDASDGSFEIFWNDLGGQNELNETIAGAEIADDSLISARGLTLVERTMGENNDVMLEICFCIPLNENFAAKVMQTEGAVKAVIRGNSKLFPLIKENIRNLFCKESDSVQ